MMRCDDVFLNDSRKRGDLPADELINGSFAKGDQKLLFAALKLDEIQISREPESDVKRFLVTPRETPLWFDEKRIHRGQQIFKHYASEIMTLLGVMALPYCYAASPGNKALYLSDKMRNRPGKRLIDTAEFVIEVLSLGHLNQAGSAHVQINKVRLTHALSRHYVSNHPDWNIGWGVPINQEDMAGTNLAFSYLILLGLELSGISLSQREKENFIFTWRYIGYLLHIDENLLPQSLAEAQQLTNAIKRRNLKYTQEGVQLASALLSFYKTNVPSWQVELIESQIRLYLGQEVAGYIGLSSNPMRDRVTSFMSDLQSLKNMVSVNKRSYLDMLSQHSLFKARVNK